MFKSAVVDAADKIPTVASGEQIFKTIKIHLVLKLLNLNGWTWKDF
jgi:hypothetical protein